MQINVLQIGTAHGQPFPFPFLLIAPLDRPTSVCFQQPFYISTIELHPLERVDALFNVRNERTTLFKLCLTPSTNLWLSTPGLVLSFPLNSPSSPLISVPTYY